MHRGPPLRQRTQSAKTKELCHDQDTAVPLRRHPASPAEAGGLADHHRSERAGLLTERTRSRRYLAIALLGSGRRRDGVALLRKAWQEFTELGLLVDAALSGLDLADALLADDAPSEVPSICRAALAQLTDAGLLIQASSALSLLSEAAALGGVSRDLLRNAHAKVDTMRRAASV